LTLEERIERLIATIPTLSETRVQILDQIVTVFTQPKAFTRYDNSDIINDQVLDDFGDVLRLHHCFSREPFSKDKFEYAFERVLVGAGIDAKLSERGQRGYDIKIVGKRCSLKTEAAKNIKVDAIHISKFMELGGGQWGNNDDDLIGLRNQFHNLLRGIDRILILRALKKGAPNYCYELVEIPTDLLERASTGDLQMMHDSPQNPKPGYCYVRNNKKEVLFCLYFDGGGERKLQIKKIPKISCTVHATWEFPPPIDSQ